MSVGFDYFVCDMYGLVPSRGLLHEGLRTRTEPRPLLDHVWTGSEGEDVETDTLCVVCGAAVDGIGEGWEGTVSRDYLLRNSGGTHTDDFAPEVVDLEPFLKWAAASFVTWERILRRSGCQRTVASARFSAVTSGHVDGSTWV